MQADVILSFCCDVRKAVIHFFSSGRNFARRSSPYQIDSKPKKHYTVYAVDSRGHGQSDKVLEYHYLDMAKDIQEMIEQLELKDISLMGSSDGAIIGLLIGSLYPKLVDHLILAGVNVDAERPAYEHIIIKPILDKRLPEVYYSHMTPYGEVVSEIRQTGRNLEMNVTVPVGSTATIYIPVGGNTSEVTESGISVRDSKDVRFERIQDGNCIVRVPQGKYKFKVDNQ